jgi:hypothetical protein
MSFRNSCAIATMAGSPGPNAKKLLAKRAPFVLRLRPTMKHPQGCVLTGDATYHDASQGGRLVLNLFAKKR